PTAQMNLGHVGVVTGDETVEPLLEEAVRNARDAGNANVLMGSLATLAGAQRLNGKPEPALASFLEALELLKESRNPEQAVYFFTDAAGMLAQGGREEDAARLLGVVSAITQRIGLKPPAYFPRLHDD